MKNNFIILILFSFPFCSHNAWRASMTSSGTENSAVKNAITDFLHTGKFDKKDTVFSIRIRHVSNDILGIGILSDHNKINVITADEVKYSYEAFPTDYVEQGGKLFYWRDSTQPVSRGLIEKLYKMNRVDTAILGRFLPNRERDDSKKSMDYYFCKSNYLIYKKIYTQVAMGWYEAPKLNCK
jgi:hypothetical protein